MPGFSKLIDRGESDAVYTKNLHIEDMTRFMIMEKLGNSLMDVYEFLGSEMKIIDVLKIGLELFSLVEKLHSKCITHQDIKPDNILFDKYVSKSEIVKIPFKANIEYLEEHKRHMLTLREEQFAHHRKLVKRRLHLIDFGNSS